jgi:hypothetical protein
MRMNPAHRHSSSATGLKDETKQIVGIRLRFPTVTRDAGPEAVGRRRARR